MFKDILPYFTTSFPEGAYVVIGLLNLLFPTIPAEEVELTPPAYLPTLFHLWSLVNRSRVFDTTFLDLFSRLARDSLGAQHVVFSEYGIFTKDQSAQIFTAILRLLDIPVGQATSPYSGAVDLAAGLAVMLERDQKKNPTSHHIARWIIMSLSPACLNKSDSILASLEALIQGVETFFHPSNSGAWTKSLSRLVYYLADFFVLRWNRERNGEWEMPDDRKLNDELKRRFVLCLRDVIFMGIFAKSGTAMNFSLSTLQVLAYLEPSLILPGALQRIYPSMQGLVEVHRTTSSLRALQNLSKIMVRTKGFRCHVTPLLGLALPGIDANDLEKTLYTLSYIQSVCYEIPFYDLTEGQEDVEGSELAARWISGEVDRMQMEGADVNLDYQNMLSDTDEELILRSSTATFAEFLTSFLGKVFTLLENLPDVAKVRSGSPEENVVNTLPAAFTPLLAALSPELYEMALNKIADFVNSHVIHQSRDALAFICNALCKINPEKALDRLVPGLIRSIRSEIDENGAASTRSAGSDVLPRDRGLVWNISMLSMCVVHVGAAVLPHKQELFEVAVYMQQKCKGVPTIHISNYVHHLLLNLTGTYTLDYSLYESDVKVKGFSPNDWGKRVNPQKLDISWHVPSDAEISFAVELFSAEGENAIGQLTSLTDGSSSIKRDGSGKEWSDEVARNLVLIRLLLSGVSVLFDANATPKEAEAEDIEMIDGTSSARSDGLEAQDEISPDDTIDVSEEEEHKPTFHYPAGRRLEVNDPLFDQVHRIRRKAGEMLHKVHQFLVEKQEDDVACFSPLYSAYRSWFVDVGIERSAHVLDRVLRLLSADIQPYKMSGLRKEYPRPLLLRRANVYHLQRLRNNSTPRPKDELTKRLLLDLAQSSVSLYTEVRRNAQGAAEAAWKSIIGARPFVIPKLLRSFEQGVKHKDFPRIKGSMYSLIFGSLSRTISRDWRHAPAVIKAYIAASDADKPSIQRLVSMATLHIMEFGKPIERMVILDKSLYERIVPEVDVSSLVEKKRDKVIRKRSRVEARKAELSEELVSMTGKLHWKQATRVAAFVVSLGMRFDSIASKKLINLTTLGAIDEHPSLRGLYSGTFSALMSLIDARATASHSYEKYLRDEQNLPLKVEIPTHADQDGWNLKFLDQFKRPDAEYYIDHDHPGWLVWTDKIPAYKVNPEIALEYDDAEQSARRQIGKLLDRKWFAIQFDYLKQEPKDTPGADRFRVPNAVMLAHTFELVLAELATASFKDIQLEIDRTYGDGTDKHQHRATAEIFGGLLTAMANKPVEIRSMVWEYAFPFIRKNFGEQTPENSTYWSTFLHLVLQGKDPRRMWPLVEFLAGFRLDMNSNAAFKESSKILLLQQCIHQTGWHFQLEKAIFKDFIEHLDHPYKAVREAIGQTLAAINQSRYYESYKDVETLIETQKKASPIGVRPYKPTSEFKDTIHDVFTRLETWRGERTAGQQTPSSYTSAGKTVLLWLDTTLSSFECTLLVEFFPGVLLEQLLHMMDIKEDAELQGLAYHVFRHMPNIPHRAGEDVGLIEALIRVGRTSPLWHQRLRVLVNIQVLYFRRLFLMSRPMQERLWECVVAMLEDSQIEVRQGASNTLSGMVRCSPVAYRDDMVQKLQKQFTHKLMDNPLPKKSKIVRSATSTGTSTPTPEHSRLMLARHAAVLGLGALVQAFPYTSPPPKWIPEVLSTLALKAHADPGTVGNSVKTILSDFKKTRQDTWPVDEKVSPFPIPSFEVVANHLGLGFHQ